MMLREGFGLLSEGSHGMLGGSGQRPFLEARKSKSVRLTDGNAWEKSSRVGLKVPSH